MDLTETFHAVAPAVVAFAETRILAPRGSRVPLSPKIRATGFIVDPVGIVTTNGHVVKWLAEVLPDPKISNPPVAAILFHYGQTDEGQGYVQWVSAPVRYYTAIGGFTPTGPWSGRPIPDIGFVQLMVTDLPALKLASKEHYVRIGMPVATAGFPMGETPLTVMGQLNQVTPFLRRGIVSSVYPFSVAHPHGFTIDIIQQGGSSGSPIFYVDAPEVVGMMSSSLTDSEFVERDGKVVEHVQNTNISICETAESLRDALEQFKEKYPPKLEGVRSLAEHLTAVPMETSIGWKVEGVEIQTTLANPSSRPEKPATNESLDDLMKEIRGRVDALEASLPRRLDPMDVSPTAKLPFKALSYRETLIWRMAELSRSAFTCFAEDKFVSAILLTRAAVETSAALWYLCDKIEAAITEKAVGDIDDYLMRLILGNRADQGALKPINVLHFVDRADKKIEGFRRQYDILSEFSHPNYAGTTNHYSRMDPENSWVDFAANIRKHDGPKGVGIYNLSVALAMFEHTYHRVAEILPAFTTLCEENLKAGSNELA